MDKKIGLLKENVAKESDYSAKGDAFCSYNNEENNILVKVDCN